MTLVGVAPMRGELPTVDPLWDRFVLLKGLQVEQSGARGQCMGRGMDRSAGGCIGMRLWAKRNELECNSWHCGVNCSGVIRSELECNPRCSGRIGMSRSGADPAWG